MNTSPFGLICLICIYFEEFREHANRAYVETFKDAVSHHRVGYEIGNKVAIVSYEATVDNGRNVFFCIPRYLEWLLTLKADGL